MTLNIVAELRGYLDQPYGFAQLDKDIKVKASQLRINIADGLAGLDSSARMSYVNMPSPKIGGMVMYHASKTVVIDTTEEYHFIDGFSDGELQGFVRIAGINGSITSVATSDGGTTITCTDTLHGLTTGDVIGITGSSVAGYNGVYEVTVLTVDTYKVVAAYSADAIATTHTGDYLLAQTGSDGCYFAHIHGSGNSAVAAKRYKFELFVNEVEQNNIVFELTPSGTAIQTGGAGGYINIVAGDRIILAVENETDATNCVLEHFNIGLHRL